MDKQKLTKSKFESFSGEVRGDSFEILVKVKTPGYIPDGVEPRSKISNNIFTASNATQKTLTQLQNDQQVVSISVSKKLQENKSK